MKNIRLLLIVIFAAMTNVAARAAPALATSSSVASVSSSAHAAMPTSTPAIALTEKQISDAVASGVEKATVEATKPDEVHWTDTVMAWATLGLMLVGVAQSFFIWRTLNATKFAARATEEAARASQKAAETADLSARAAVGVELPRVFLRSVSVTRQGGPFDFMSVMSNPVFTIELRNYGRSPAHVYKHSMCVAICDSGTLPRDPVYTSVSDLPPGVIIGAGDSHKEMFSVQPFTAAQIEKVYDNAAFLWVYGYIDYQDFLRTYHTVRFCALMTFDESEDGVMFEFREGYGPASYRGSSESETPPSPRLNPNLPPNAL